MWKARFIPPLIASISLLASACGPGADDPAQFKAQLEEASKTAKKGKELMKGARKKPPNVPKRPVDELG
jgi:hypothetical protein